MISARGGTPTMRPYRLLAPAQRTKALLAEDLLFGAAETARLEGRWRDHDFVEYVLAVARDNGLHVWPAYVRGCGTRLSPVPRPPDLSARPSSRP